MTRAAAVLVLLTLASPQLRAAPPSAAAGNREAALRANAALERAGKYKAAVLSYMDMVIADPSDEAARTGLRAAAARASAGERRTAAAEREALLAGAGRDRRRALVVRAAAERRLTAWKKNFSKACSLAAGADTVREAVEAYGRLLGAAPVYSFDGGYLLEATARIKGIFYKTIKGEYPYLVEGREYADERDIAALMFARDSAQDASSRYMDSGAAQNVLDTADKLRRLERGLAARRRALERGIELYTRGRYLEACDFFDEVLAGDPRNEEAAFYSAVASEKLSAAAADKNRGEPDLTR